MNSSPPASPCLAGGWAALSHLGPPLGPGWPPLPSPSGGPPCGGSGWGGKSTLSQGHSDWDSSQRQWEKTSLPLYPPPSTLILPSRSHPEAFPHPPRPGAGRAPGQGSLVLRPRALHTPWEPSALAEPLESGGPWVAGACRPQGPLLCSTLRIACLVCCCLGNTRRP